MEELTREEMSALAADALAALNEALNQLSQFGALHESAPELAGQDHIEAAFRDLEQLARRAIWELSFFLPGNHARGEELAQKAIDRMLEHAGEIPDRGY